MSAPAAELDARVELARAACGEAASVVLRWFQDPDLGVERKGDDSPVTRADREAEEHLRDHIARSFPGDAVLGEEHGETDGTTGFRWILDPIDGTRAFIRGVPLFGMLVGIEYRDQVEAGVVLLPALDEELHARTGGGAHWRRGREERPARVSGVSRLDRALFTATSSASFDARGTADAYRRLSTAAGETRGWGDCYGYVLVATGRVEVMVDPELSVWDAAAILPVVQEAGGRYTDWTGAPDPRGGTGVATNGALHEEVLGLLRA